MTKMRRPISACLLLASICFADDRWTLYRAAIAAADASLRLNETAAAQAWLRATPEEHRGWEHRYLKAMSNRSLATLTAHDAAITGLAVDSSGELAATTSEDKTVRVWNAALGTEVAVFQGHMWSPAFRPKARELAAIGADGTVRVWSLDSRREVRKYEASGRAVAWSSDGKFLVASNGALWDFEQDKLLWKSARPFTAIAFHPTKPEFVAATADGAVGIYAVDGTGKARVEVRLDGVQSLAFTASGFLVASKDGTVREFDASNARPLRTFTGHTRSANAVIAFKNWIVSGASDETVRPWDGASRHILHGHTAPVNAVAATSERILSGDASGRLYWWDPVALTRTVSALEIREFPMPPAVATDPNPKVPSPDGKRQVSACADRTVCLWDSATGELLLRIPFEWDVRMARFSADGSKIAVGATDGRMVILGSR